MPEFGCSKSLYGQKAVFFALEFRFLFAILVFEF